MHARPVILAVLLLIATCVTPFRPLAAQAPSGYTTWYGELRNLRPDPARGTLIEDGLTLVRDAGTIHLDRGQLNLLAPIDGRTVGAVFTGQGRFEMTTPEPVEQDQLRRAFGSDEISTSFRAAVILFTDSTEAELAHAVSWEALTPDREAQREAEEARDYFTDAEGWVDRTLLMPLLNGGPGFFYAHLSENRSDPMIFAVDPLSFEEVTLSQRTDRGKRRELVTQFHQRSDYEAGRSTPQEGLDVVSITGYDIETRIDSDLRVVGRATASLQRMRGAYDWVPFRLYSLLEVDSIAWSDGTAVPFHRGGETSDLWLDLSSAPEASAEITFHYSGKLMERTEGLWVALGSHTTWYPVYEYGREIPYRLTFHAPDDYEVTTVGTRVSESTENETTTTVWETGTVRSVTFNIGEFDRLESREADAPNLTVLVNEGAHRRLGGMVAEAGGVLPAQQDMSQMVALDVRNSFRVFNEVFGPTPVRDFVATEIPYNHGEAYPGLIMLAWNTFQWTTSEGFDEMFRAHEVAHQWWGIGVRPATYRDWWLAEGFSEFSGWWYAARAKGSLDMYRRRLEETRKAIIERRDRAGPVALGTRVGTTEHPEDYQLTVYHKGAWVLHMLRALLTDPDTGNDDAFTQVMSTFYQRHAGGEASTGSFQQVVEEVVGGSMDWFFEQWVFGTSIPTYVFSHRYEDQPDGGVKAVVRVRQENVPEDFQMIVPVLVDFGADGTALVQVRVVGPVTETELPLLPREPDRIVFNPDEAVLAETRTERWRE
jgi:hypothetical protein